MTLPDDRQAREILRGIGLVGVAVFLFALTDAISKYMTQFYPIGFILWIRFFFHTLVLLAVVGGRQGLGFVRTRRPGIQLTRGLLLPLAALMFVSAISQMPLAETVAITFVSPLIVTLLAVVVLKEHVSVGHWIAISCSFAGVLVIIRPGTEGFHPALLLALANAVLDALFNLFTRHLAAYDSAEAMQFIAGAVAVVMLAPFALVAWRTP